MEPHRFTASASMILRDTRRSLVYGQRQAPVVSLWSWPQTRLLPGCLTCCRGWSGSMGGQWRAHPWWCPWACWPDPRRSSQQYSRWVGGWVGHSGLGIHAGHWPIPKAWPFNFSDCYPRLLLVCSPICIMIDSHTLLCFHLPGLRASLPFTSLPSPDLT